MNHLRKCLCGLIPQNAHIKRLTSGDFISVQGQILHISAHRNVRLPLILTRLSGKESQRRGLCISLIKESKEGN